LALGLLVSAAACALLGAGNFACTSSDPHGASGPSIVLDPIVIGVSDTLTGGLKGIGTPLQNAVKVAEQYINSAGGVLGRKVRFVIKDDASDEGAVVTSTVNSLLGDNAAAILGPNGSGQVAAVEQLLADRQIVELSATATSPILTRKQSGGTGFFFRTVPPDDFQGRAVVNVVVNGPQGTAPPSSDAGVGAGAFCKRLGLFYYTNTYGTAMAAVIKQVIKDKHPAVSIVADVMVDVAVKSSYGAEVGQIVLARPDCVAMIVYDDVGDVFMTNLIAATTPAPSGWNPNFFVIGTDGVFTADFVVNGRQNRADPKSPTAADGVYGTNPDTNPATTQYNDFKNLYVAAFPLSPGATDLDAYVANEFDAALVIALAIQQARGTSDRIKLRDAIYANSSDSNKAYGPADLIGALEALERGDKIHYRGASGDLQFDPRGDVVAGYIVWRANKTGFDTIRRIKPEELP
jgi:branched-chain amino acid transport system substrate-binding protein